MIYCFNQRTALLFSKKKTSSTLTDNFLGWRILFGPRAMYVTYSCTHHPCGEEWGHLYYSLSYAGPRAPRGSVTRQSVVLTDLQALVDYQIAHPSLKDQLVEASIYKDQKFSDHAPLIIDYKL